MPSETEIYKYIVDIIIPLGTFILGLIIEQKWHIAGNYFHINDKSETEQSQKVKGNVAQALQARDIHGDVIMGDIGSVPESLPYKESEFVKTISRVLTQKNTDSTFGDRYEDGYKHRRNNSVTLAASAYLSAFLQVKEVFLEKENYHSNVSEDLITALENGLVNLKNFSDQALNNQSQLETIIKGIEDTLGSLFGYIK